MWDVWVFLMRFNEIPERPATSEARSSEEQSDELDNCR